MSSVAKAELGALFINAKTTGSMPQMPAELGHPQPRTLMQTNNATAHALITNKILPKALKAMDMCFHWLGCRNPQGQVCYYLRPGTQNIADYFTKHHPISHQKTACPTILTPTNEPDNTKLFKTSLIPVKFEPQSKTLVSTKLFVKNLLQTPRFKTMTVNKVTAQVPENSYGKGVLDLQVSTYLSDGTNRQISSNSCQSYDAP
jgi:hypothetical protein